RARTTASCTSARCASVTAHRARADVEKGSRHMPPGMPKRFVPEPSPETRPFWEGCKAGELRLQRCLSCSHTYFPPRPFCPKCAHREVTWFKASGKGKLYSYVIHHRPMPGFTP